MILHIRTTLEEIMELRWSSEFTILENVKSFSNATLQKPISSLRLDIAMRCDL